jgi:Protein of unknown function (DUF3347)
MKKLFILLLSGCMFFAIAKANYYPASLVRQTQIQSSMTDLLNLYYDIKNALFSSNAAEASAKAGLLLKAINSIDMTKLSEKDQTVFKSLQNKLGFDARHIAEVQNIDHQREHFASLSLNMYTLAKSVTLSKQPVYEDYCPMKKVYWLSSEAAIKNPYFGEQMPDCGEIKHTLP